MILWQKEQLVKTLRPITPLVASWNAKADPAQMRLQEYLHNLAHRLEPLPQADLFLHIDVDVERPERLLRHYDLENYLTPVAAHLGARRFQLMSAEKQVGHGSQLTVGTIAPLEAQAQGNWQSFSRMLHGSAQNPQWKKELRSALTESGVEVLRPGPVEVRLAFRCSPQRNWVWLWKPAGDAMGPVLGEPSPLAPFNPNDDRITRLQLHLHTDPSIGHAVEVGMWWRPAS